MRYLILFVSLFFLMSCNDVNKNNEPPVEEPEEVQGRILDYTGTVSFINYDGDVISTIEVAVADDSESRQAGLMDVHHLPQDKGMLFIFEQSQVLRFWMANTPLSLDIIFVDQDKKIVRIHRDTPPYSTRHFSSGDPAIYAVEVNAGYTSMHDIQEEMFISYTVE